MTNVFISWSGDVSREIADELRRWIPSVLQFAKPYFTPNDIEKGAKWSTEISEKLNESNVGIICLTRDNISKPWILFEAGALSKDLKNSRVCSVLFGLDNADISGPLTTFQTTLFNKSDFKKMMQTINSFGGDNSLSSETFGDVFEMWWPKLEAGIRKHLDKDQASAESVRTERELLEEILEISRLNSRNEMRSVAQRFSRVDIPSRAIDDLLDGINASVEILVSGKVAEESLYLSTRKSLKAIGFLIKSRSYGAELEPRLDEIRKSFDEYNPD